MPSESSKPSEPSAPKAVLHSRWWPVGRVMDAVDAEIAGVYDTPAFRGLKPTWVMELLQLHDHGPLTITQLAEATDRTHSALSQKVTTMRAAGLVRTMPGRDARSKRVMLTAKARRLAGRMAAEWRATEAVIEEIEAEIPYPLSRAVEDVEAALARRSFRDRLVERLSADPEWSSGPTSSDRGDPRWG